jgi:MFS family permease
MSLVSAERSWNSLALIRLNAFSFGVTGFLLAMDTVVLPVIVLTLAPESLKNTYLAMLGMGGLLVAAVMQPLIGRVSDRTRSPLGRRVPYIIYGTVVVCACLVLVVLASSITALFAAWMLIQANLNVAYAPGMALIRDLVPRARIGVASSVKILMDAIGGLTLITASAALIGQAAGSELGPVYVNSELGSLYVNWEWAVLALLGAVLIITVAITCATVLAQGARLRPRPPRRSDAPLGPVLNPQLALFLVSRLLLMTAIYSFPTYGLFFLKDVVQAENPAETLSRMIPAIGGSLAVAVYLGGWASDRIGRKPIVIAGAAGAAVSTSWLLLTDTTTGLVITASIIGASAGSLLSASWALANELGDEERAGTHIGIVNLSTIGGATLPRLFGPGIDLLNHASEDLGYRALIIGCAALFAMGALAILPVSLTAGIVTREVITPHHTLVKGTIRPPPFAGTPQRP